MPWQIKSKDSKRLQPPTEARPSPRWGKTTPIWMPVVISPTNRAHLLWNKTRSREQTWFSKNTLMQESPTLKCQITSTKTWDFRTTQTQSLRTTWTLLRDRLAMLWIPESKWALKIYQQAKRADPTPNPVLTKITIKLINLSRRTPSTERRDLRVNWEAASRIPYLTINGCLWVETCR